MTYLILDDLEVHKKLREPFLIISFKRIEILPIFPIKINL